MKKTRGNKKNQQCGIPVEVWYGGIIESSQGLVKYQGGQATCFYNVKSMNMDWIEDTVKGLGYQNYLSCAFYPWRENKFPEEVSLEFVETEDDVEKMFDMGLNYGFLKIYVEAVNLNVDIVQQKPINMLVEPLNVEPVVNDDETDDEINEWFRQYEESVKYTHDEANKENADETETDDEYMTAKKNLMEFNVENVESDVNDIGEREKENVESDVNDIGGSESVHRDDIEGAASENQSEYGDSDEPSTPVSSDPDDIEGSKNKKNITYNPKCKHSEMKWQVGLIFTKAEQFKNAIQNYAIEGGYGLHWKRICEKRMEVGCKNCLWRVYAVKVRNERTYIVKTVTGKHSCSRITSNNKMCNRQWLASEYLKEYKNKSALTISEFQAHMLTTYGLKVATVTCYRAKWLALDTMRGTLESHYARLRSYVAELKRTNREGTFELDVNSDAGKSYFKGFYICFSGLRKGFLGGCRSVISLDGAFLKTIMGGCILSAIGRDRNNQMFPVAWAVVNAENEDTWTWFLHKLFSDLAIRDGFGWTFISDQQKGLLNALVKLVPHSGTRNCARHIYANWKKKIAGAEYKQLFWNIVYAKNVPRYQYELQELKTIDPLAADDLVGRDVNKFCKAFISTWPKCDSVDNNIAETFNGWICKARLLPIIDMLEDIRTELMQRLNEKFQLMEKREDDICPRIRKRIDKLKWESRFCVPKATTNDKFQVKIGDEQYVVNLSDKTCSCRYWQLIGIPCVHGVSSIGYLRMNVDDYVDDCVDDCYKKAKYMEAYKWHIDPINGPNMWPICEGIPVSPPPFKKMPGRPKTKRRKSADELQSPSSTKLTKHGVRMRCTRCLGFDHNERSCKNNPPPPSAAPNNTTSTSTQRGRKRKSDGSGPSQASTDSINARERHTGDKRAIARDRAKARQGFGQYVSTETGNCYVRMPGDKSVRYVSGPAAMASLNPTSSQTSTTLNTNLVNHEGQDVLPKPTHKFKSI